MVSNVFPMITTQEMADICTVITPDWRWQAALAIVENPDIYYRSLDPKISEAIAYLQNEELGNRLAIQQVQQIHIQDELLRAKIEALVLANVSADAIATRCDLRPEVVEAYEDLFFSVRRHLHSHGWLLIRTVGRTHWDGFQNDQIRQFWAWLAIAGGPLIAEHAIDTYESIATQKAPFCLLTYFRTEADGLLPFLAFIATYAIPADEDGMRVSLDLGLRYREIEACPDPDLQRQMREEAQKATIQYVRQALQEEPREWAKLTGTSPAAENPLEAPRSYHRLKYQGIFKGGFDI